MTVGILSAALVGKGAGVVVVTTIVLAAILSVGITLWYLNRQQKRH